MAVRAFAAEDGNLQTKSVVVAKEKVYRDIDLTFARKPSGDIYKKTDAAAVKQAVKNILLTNLYEKPFAPQFGSDLSSLLFSLDTDFAEGDVRERIINSINKYEPRARVMSVKTTINGDQNSARVTVTFQILSTSEEFTIDLTLARLR
jgi:phage baseplate assembly protein W